MISVCFQGKPFNIRVIQVYAPTSNAEEAEVEQFYEDLQDLVELTPKKICPFHFTGLEYKSRKSRNTWSNRQIWPWDTEWSRAKAKFCLCQENALVIANTLFQEHKRRRDTWASPDGQHRNQIDYILCSQRWRSSIQSAKTRPGADCDSDHELLIAIPPGQPLSWSADFFLGKSVPQTWFWVIWWKNNIHLCIPKT